jgi:hypothetical protein
MKLLKMGAAQEMNGDIDEEEVLEAMKKLKWNKAVGVDDMQADLIIAGKVFLAEPLTALFKMFSTQSTVLTLCLPVFNSIRHADRHNFHSHPHF